MDIGFEIISREVTRMARENEDLRGRFPILFRVYYLWLKAVSLYVEINTNQQDTRCEVHSHRYTAAIHLDRSSLECRQLDTEGGWVAHR